MKFSQIVLTIILAAAVSFGILHFAKPAGVVAAAKETAFERVKRTGVIRCGYAAWAPAVFKDANTGAVAGRNVDVMQAIGDYLELKIEWTVETGWGNYAEDLDLNKFDVMCATVWPDAGRVKNALMTKPLYFNGLYVLVRADDHRFDAGESTINDPSITIATIDGDMTDSIADSDFPKAKKLALPHNVDGSHMAVSVETRKADLTLGDKGYFDAYNEINPGKLRMLSDMPHVVFGETMPVKLGEWELRDMLEAAIDELSNRGVLKKVLQKWQGGVLARAPDYAPLN